MIKFLQVEDVVYNADEERYAHIVLFINPKNITEIIVAGECEIDSYCHVSRKTKNSMLSFNFKSIICMTKGKSSATYFSYLEPSRLINIIEITIKEEEDEEFKNRFEMLDIRDGNGFPCHVRVKEKEDYYTNNVDDKYDNDDIPF